MHACLPSLTCAGRDEKCRQFSAGKMPAALSQCACDASIPLLHCEAKIQLEFEQRFGSTLSSGPATPGGPAKPSGSPQSEFHRRLHADLQSQLESTVAARLASDPALRRRLQAGPAGPAGADAIKPDKLCTGFWEPDAWNDTISALTDPNSKAAVCIPGFSCRQAQALLRGGVAGWGGFVFGVGVAGWLVEWVGVEAACGMGCTWACAVLQSEGGCRRRLPRCSAAIWTHCTALPGPGVYHSNFTPLTSDLGFRWFPWCSTDFMAGPVPMTASFELQGCIPKIDLAKVANEQVGRQCVGKESRKSAI